MRTGGSWKAAAIATTRQGCALCGRLGRLGVARVAIERPDGLLIERLLDAGLTVVAVHPNQVVAMRPRYSVAGGKSDGFDSFVLAELARTDSHRFRVLEPDGDQTKALRALTRAREGLVRTRVGLANQLRDQLACFWPGASKVFCASTRRSRWRSCALSHHRWTPAVSVSSVCGVPGAPRLSRSQARQGAIETAPRRCEGRAGELELAARRQVVLALVSALEPVVARISELTIEIRHASTRIPTARRSARCSSRTTPGFAPRRCSPRSATAGSATPATAPSLPTPAKPPSRSSQAKAATQSFDGPATTDSAARSDTLADASRRHNPWAADIYDRARARGATHTHATRILGRAWSQVIWRLWHDHDAYDPLRHTALQRLAAAA